MNIDIYCLNRSTFIAVPHRHDLPTGWEGSTLFKTIELLSGEVRIGMGDADAALASLESQGWSTLDEQALAA